MLYNSVSCNVFRLIITARLVRVLLFIRIVTGKDQVERATRRMVSGHKFAKLDKKKYWEGIKDISIQGISLGAKHWANSVLSCEDDSSQGKVFHQEVQFIKCFPSC